MWNERKNACMHLTQKSRRKVGRGERTPPPHCMHECMQPGEQGVTNSTQQCLVGKLQHSDRLRCTHVFPTANPTHLFHFLCLTCKGRKDFFSLRHDFPGAFGSVHCQGLCPPVFFRVFLAFLHMWCRRVCECVHMRKRVCGCELMLCYHRSKHTSFVCCDRVNAARRDTFGSPEGGL